MRRVYAWTAITEFPGSRCYVLANRFTDGFIMTTTRGAAFGALLAMLLVFPLRAQDTVDPARWGFYKELVGKAAQAGPEGYRVQWRWEKPGEVLVEEYSAPRSGKTAYVSTITAGAKPGTWVLASTFLGKVWDGTLQPDGSISYIARGLLKMPFRALLAGDGAFEMRRTKVKDGVIVSENPVRELDRFLPLDDTPAPAAVASAPPAKTSGLVGAKLEAQSPAAVPTPVAPAPAPAPVPAPTSYGFLERFVGRSLVSDQYTLDIYREGDGIALHYGIPGGVRVGRYLLRPGSSPGTFEFAETRYDSIMTTRKRTAYFDTDGALVLEYNGAGSHCQVRFYSNGSLLEETDFSGIRAIGINHKLKQDSYYRYGPATKQSVEMARATREYLERQHQEQLLEEKRERDEQWSRNVNALNERLQDATAEASAREAQSRAALDATLQAAQIQAQREQAARDREERERARRERDAAAAVTAQRVAPSPGTVKPAGPAPQNLPPPARPTPTPTLPANTPAPVATPVATPAVPSKPKGCTMVHPKLNTLFNTVQGEARGLKGARDGAALFCQNRTGQPDYTGVEKCTADGPYQLNCTIVGQCNGLASQTCGNSQ